MKTLVYFLDKFYLPVILPIKMYEIDKLLLLVSNNYKNKYSVYTFKDYILDKFPNMKISIEEINHYSEIGSFLPDTSEDYYAYFDGQMNVYEMVLFEKLPKNIGKLVLSEKSTLLYEFKNDQIIEHSLEAYDYRINDLVESFGGSICSEDSEIFSTKGVKDYIQWIDSNYDYFEKLNQNLFKKSDIFINDYKHLNSSMVLQWKLNDYTNYLLINLLDFLKSKNHIEYSVNKKRHILFINYLDQGLKEVMKKPGVWLEAKVYQVIKKMEIFDEVKAGVEFLWDEDSDKIKNEVDLIATKDQKVLCISCKDTKRHNKESYNELSTYTRKLAGNEGSSLLIATEDPTYSYDLDRIKQMPINYFLYEGDDNTLECFISNMI